MPIKQHEPGDDPRIHRWDGGATWIAHPGERMRRASHALSVDGAVWVVEPVDVAGLDDLLADLGSVAGVVVLADYHRRDAVAVARRHDAPVFLPETVADLASELDAPVEVFQESLPGTDYRAVPLLGGLPWTEAALHDPATGTLVATETLVTCDSLTGPGERLAVTPYVRLVPPRTPLRGLDVRRVLVGHGDPIHEGADAALASALADARRGAPGVIGRNLPYLLRAAWIAMRD